MISRTQRRTRARTHTPRLTPLHLVRRVRSDEARRQALTRGEIFPSRQLAAKRAAAAVQRACDAAAAAEVVFLPTDASARAIAEVRRAALPS